MTLQHTISDVTLALLAVEGPFQSRSVRLKLPRIILRSTSVICPSPPHPTNSFIACENTGPLRRPVAVANSLTEDCLRNECRIGSGKRRSVPEPFWNYIIANARSEPILMFLVVAGMSDRLTPLQMELNSYRDAAPIME
jgi:hypothetical protein